MTGFLLCHCEEPCSEAIIFNSKSTIPGEKIMPSFDIVSKVDLHELTNAVDQANREVSQRFDFRGTNASFELVENEITLKAPSEFQLKQMLDILYNKLAKRHLDTRSLEALTVESNLHEARQKIKIQHGIEQTFAKKITQLIKDKGAKVQASIQGDQVRVTGKKKDDLQTVIAMLRGASLELPVQFENFRD
jgi:hypothetical protein